MTWFQRAGRAGVAAVPLAIADPIAASTDTAIGMRPMKR